MVAFVASTLLIITTITILILYFESFESNKIRLIEKIKSQARVIEAVSRFDELQHVDESISDPLLHILGPVRSSFSHFEGYGETGEFVLATLEGEKVVFQFAFHHLKGLYDLTAMEPVLVNSSLAEPMQRALKGESGTMVGYDYNGTKVLAAYEPVGSKGLKAGLVSKIDITEIRAPFIRASVIMAVCSVFIIWLGAYFFKKIRFPAVLTLEESEERYRRLIELSPDGYVIHTGGVVVFANDAAARLTGYGEPGNLVGMAVMDFVHPEYRTVVAERISKMVVEKERVPTIEEKFLMKDGSFLDVEVTAMPFTYHGEPAVQLIFRDIGERKKAEVERSRHLKAIEQSAETILITDKDGTIVYVNPAFEKITGYTREEALGRNPRILKSDKHDKAFYEKMWEILASGGVWTGLFINKKKDGTLYQEDVTISPVFSSKGEIVNYVAVKRDVTEQKMLDRGKEFFTSVISHELRTPITKLKLIRLLLDNYYSTHQKPREFIEIYSVLDAANKGLDGILTQTDLIIDLYASSPDKNFRPVSILNCLVSSVKEAGSYCEMENRNVSIRVDVGLMDKETVVMGKEEMIRVAILNIISNAVKFTPDGKNVNITGKSLTGEAIIEIVDEGTGIPEDQKEKVFEPYFSLENILHHSSGEYKFKGGGVGLGLTISRMILEYHNGQLSIESLGVGNGVSVTLKFPVSAV